MRRIAKYVVAALLAVATPVFAGKAAATCSIYFQSTVYGSTPYLATTVAVSPFTVSCSPGVYSGTLTALNAGSMTLQLEKQVSGSWTVVQNSTYISYSGGAGTYRYTVRSLGNGPAQWSLNYKTPVQ
jgi:hypothetical protein